MEPVGIALIGAGFIADYHARGPEAHAADLRTRGYASRLQCCFSLSLFKSH